MYSFHAVPPSSVHISSSQGMFLPSGVRSGKVMGPRHHPKVLTGETGSLHPALEQNKVINITAGSTLTLECLVADARPEPAVSWYRNGQLIDSCECKDLRIYFYLVNLLNLATNHSFLFVFRKIIYGCV